MIERDLRLETEKWLKKIDEKRKEIELKDETKKNMLKNIDAYIADSRHFLEQGDLIKSFECVLWAWAWIEILKELNIIEYHNIGQGLIERKK